MTIAAIDKTLTYCHHRTRTENGRRFICIAPRHDDIPTAHVFRRDPEDPMKDAPSNAQLESALEAIFYTEVRKVGGYPVKTMPTRKGFPDRLVVFPGGHVYLVELKAVGKTLSDAQKVVHQRLAQLGVSVVTLTGRDEVVRWVHEHVGHVGPQFRGYNG